MIPTSSRAGLIAVLLAVSTLHCARKTPVIASRAGAATALVPPPAPLSLVVALPNPVGTWRASGETAPDPNGRRMGWFAQYEFRADGTFQLTGYPPLAVTGRWTVLGRESIQLRVKLTEQKLGSGTWPDKEADFAFSTTGKSFRWDDRVYERQ